LRHIADHDDGPQSPAGDLYLDAAAEPLFPVYVAQGENGHTDGLEALGFRVYVLDADVQIREILSGMGGETDGA